MILPTRRTVLPELLQEVFASPSVFKQLFMKSLYLNEMLGVHLPAFSVESSLIAVKECLRDMGLSTVFDSQSAQFDNLTESSQFCLSEMFFKASIKVSLRYAL